MKTTCIWCGNSMGEKPPYDDKRETHGVCKKCQKVDIEERVNKFKKRKQ
jgi:hypothetical protein